MVEIMKNAKTINTLRIYGRRWFQKTYGNTYHAVRVIVNGEEIISNVTYGYGDHYKETARQLLESNGFEVPESLKFNRYLHDNGFEATVVNVDRKKDLLD